MEIAPILAVSLLTLPDISHQNAPCVETFWEGNGSLRYGEINFKNMTLHRGTFVCFGFGSVKCLCYKMIICTSNFLNILMVMSSIENLIANIANFQGKNWMSSTLTELNLIMKYYFEI